MATLTVYPDAGSGATTVDGRVARSISSETFSTIRSGSGNVAFTSEEFLTQNILASSTSNQYSVVTRLIFTFDTSPLGSSASISSAVFSLYGNGKANGFSGTAPELDVVSATPASNNNLVSADYGQTGSTPFASVTYSSWTSSVYNDFTLDSNGIANVSKTGISKFATRLNWDTDNSVGGTWVSGAEVYFDTKGADASGTTQDPKLVITYTVSARTDRFFSMF
jgi:hypothetical protein